MNRAQTRLGRGIAAVKLTALGSGSGLLAACSMVETPAVLVNPPIAPSPVAQQVLTAAQSPGPYPEFADIPRMPSDVRPAAGWAVAVTALGQDNAALDAQVAARPPTLFGTEAWAAEQAAAAAAPAALSTTSTEEFLSDTRRDASPPPPPR